MSVRTKRRRRNYDRPTPVLLVNLLQHAYHVDKCRGCGCTELTPCRDVCAWADAEHTVCTSCLDKRFRIVRSVVGSTYTLVDKRSGYRRHFNSPRAAALEGVRLIRGGR